MLLGSVRSRHMFSHVLLSRIAVWLVDLGGTKILVFFLTLRIFSVISGPRDILLDCVGLGTWPKLLYSSL